MTRQDDDENDDAIPSTPLLPPEPSNLTSPPILLSRTASEHCCLSLPLQVLFGFNGITLSLPMTALMYIVNTRVEMPVSMLPTYGAVAFLPFSLKPFYAYFSSSFLLVRRDRLIATLLLLGGMGAMATAHVTTVTGCLLLGVGNGIASAWPEFLLGLTLLDYVSNHHDNGVNECAAQLQAQAATARNVGALVAHVLVLLLLWMLPCGQDGLNDQIVTQMFFVTSLFHVVGACIALSCRVGCEKELPDLASDHDSTTGTAAHVSSRRNSYHSFSDEENPPASHMDLEADELTTGTMRNEEEDTVVSEGEPFVTLVNEGASAAPTAPWSSPNARLVILLQLTILLVALKEPLHKATHKGWSWMLSATVGALVVQVGVAALTAWQKVATEGGVSWIKIFPRSHRVGLFLILRHALPSVSYLMSAFLYDVFQTAPAFLTVLSLWDMLLSSLASWSYGKLWSGYTTTRVLVGTTVAASITVWLANGALLRLLSSSPSNDVHLSIVMIAATLLLKAGLTITSEWKFLPDVVLATTEAVPEQVETRSMDGGSESVSSGNRAGSTGQIGLRYGTLVACIDFGGQLGALLVGPLVAAFGTSRENHWEHMESLVSLTGMLTLLPLVFLVLLR